MIAGNLESTTYGTTHKVKWVCRDNPLGEAGSVKITLRVKWIV